MTKRMSPNSLYKLCLKETALHLHKKYWNKEILNPFSQINCYIVNDLFQFLVIYTNIKKPSPLKLLLKSGQLQNLMLDGCNFTKKQWKSVMKILLEEGDSCRNITYIALPESFQNAENDSLERLIEKCPLLERLVVSTFFNLSALKNCVRLKYVRNYFCGLKEYRYFWNEAADTLANLQNLEKFDIFHYRNSSSYYTLIAKMLQNHPKLVSLGNTDSSWAAHHIYTTYRMEIVPQFGLKECFWGFNINVGNCKENPIAFTQQFPEFVKSSVALFPLVEKLCIVVYHEDCIEHLKKLKYLRVLKIDFNLCYGLSARTAFISLLSEIGPQLKQLLIVGRLTVPVDLVMKYCSNVVSLELRCNTIVQGGIETDSNNFRQLEMLNIRRVNEESLEYLLRNSLNLRVLIVTDALCLDDTLLHKILKKSSLSQVIKISVCGCRLSDEGVNELFQKCVNLEIAIFDIRNANMTTEALEWIRKISDAYYDVKNNGLIV